MNRIDATFDKLKSQKKKAFIAYIVAGDPTIDKTVDLVLTLEKSGVDIIELGVPFSDPVADGVVNQLGSQRALSSGTTLTSVLECVSKIRKHSQIPVVFFSYYNPIYKMGLQKFLSQAEKVGADGALILDLPPEEAARDWPTSSGIKRITLIAPTTPKERIAHIVSGSSGFIYYVSREGVTGMQSQVANNLQAHIESIRACTTLPVCVGFGISNPEQASKVATLAEGVVVGSAIVHQIGSSGQSPELASIIGKFVSPISEAIHAA